MAKNKTAAQASKASNEDNGAQAPAPKKLKKTVCPITRKHFKEHAKPVPVEIAGAAFGVSPKADEKIDTEGVSLGFFLNDKVTLVIGGVPTKCQVGLNITVIGSKELPVE